MIKFQGNVNTEVERYAIKRGRMLMSVMDFMAIILVSGTLLLLGFTSGILIPFICGAAGGLGAGICMIIFIHLPRYNTDYTNNCPDKVLIEDDRVSVYSRANNYACRKTEDIKTVLDFGNFYHIKFYFPWDPNFICQKDLIVEGTLEEFEELFADKLVRKTPKEKE